MGRPFLAARPHSFRNFHNIRWRLLFSFFIILLFVQQHLFFVHRQSLAEKYSPTDFEPTQGDQHTRSLRPDDEDSQFVDDLIVNHESWKSLGKGWEGKVFAYEDSVIKTFTPGRSPFRNCAPGGDGERWPTEITASIRFGGSSTHFKSKIERNTTLNGFLPVKAYFKAAVVSANSEWHLVMPLVQDGSVVSLAKKIAKNDKRATFTEIDAQYRPAFEKLLGYLGKLHVAGYCHDDVKPANIFVQSDSEWLLGDLGNVREIAHPYHSSRLWRDNDQLPDCRANDIMRALKTYLKFIQTACIDLDRFNEEFFEGREPTSRLYWRSIAETPNLNAEILRQISFAEYPEQAVALDEERIDSAVPNFRFFNLLFSRSSSRRRMVDRTLQTRMGEKVARWWGLTWLFGMPDSLVCGV